MPYWEGSVGIVKALTEITWFVQSSCLEDTGLGVSQYVLGSGPSAPSVEVIALGNKWQDLFSITVTTISQSCVVL